MLHDTVEDTETTFEEIEAEFGKEVVGYVLIISLGCLSTQYGNKYSNDFLICRVVREVTDDKSLPKEERKRLQVETAPKKSPQAKLVKLADKLYNLRYIFS